MQNGHMLNGSGNNSNTVSPNNSNMPQQDLNNTAQSRNINTANDIPKSNNVTQALSRYNNSLKAGLNHGQKFTKLMDELITTKTYRDLLLSSEQLASFKMNTQDVRFPFQYNRNDFCLIFMSRLLEKDHIGDNITMMTNNNGRIAQIFSSIGSYDTFLFMSADDNEHGVYYEDSRFKEQLFYLNLKKKEMKFDSRAVTNLFLDNFSGNLAADRANTFARTLVDFGSCLVNHYHFNVDFSIFNTTNNFHPFKDMRNAHDIMNNLFVSAAKNGYILKSYQGRGGELDLSNNLQVDVLKENNQWGLAVIDSQSKISWLDIVIKYKFFREWYLKYLKQLLLK